MKRNVRVYLQDMHENMLKALEYTESLDYEAFAADSKTNYAVVRCLEIIGEAAKNIPDQVRNDYPEIPWRRMAERGSRIRRVASSPSISGICTSIRTRS